MERRHPEWIRVQIADAGEFFQTRQVVKEFNLHTVCEEARCPNLRECWGHGTATFMLGGDTCTRGCRFCSVTHGRPQTLDQQEPRRLAEAVAALQLQHVVVTAVARDDLADGGAAHFAETAAAIKHLAPDCRVEVLIPDFRGNEDALRAVVDAPIDVLDHNLETVPRLYTRVRPGAIYERSLRILHLGKQWRPALVTKTGLMVGLGETAPELEAVFADLQTIACDVLTLGQYLRPSLRQLPVERYVPPEEFASLRAAALRYGFRHVEAGPFVRSSYHAWQHVPSTEIPTLSGGQHRERKETFQ